MNKLLPNPCFMSGFLNSGELSFDQTLLKQLIKVLKITRASQAGEFDHVRAKLIFIFM